MATQRLIIELETSVLPRGQVIGVDGKELAFTGWVELAAALEQARGVPATSEDRFDAPAGPSELRGTSARE